MDIRKTNTLSAAQKESLLRLWNREYPVQLSFPSVRELEQYLRTLERPVHYVMAYPGVPCMAWACAFNREGERWFALIVDHAVQQKGVGTAMLHALKADYAELNGWVTDHDRYLKPNGETYRSPKVFYVKNGFSCCRGQRLETDKLSAVKIKWEAPTHRIIRPGKPNQ